MTIRTKFDIFLAILWLVAFVGYCSLLTHIHTPPVKIEMPLMSVFVPRVQESLEVAKVFGRDGDCKTASPSTIFMIVDAADAAKLDPKLVAAVVAKESSCNPFAVSRSGAVGLMQVLIKEHQSEFDFSKVNLFNPKDNLAIGTAILKDYVSKYGLQKGLQHYQGVGKNCDTCDMNYVKKIQAIMEGK